MKTPLPRRHFLRQAACAGMGAAPLINTLLNLRLAGSVAAAAPGVNDYRALVCLFLPGGIDSFNLLVPRGDDEHAEYKAVRKDLALAKDVLLPITPTVDPGLTLGLHPGVAGLQALFEEGKASFVANVGTLVERVTAKSQVWDESKRLPLGLFSHSDQIEQWQTSMPNTRSSRGWAGRAADMLRSLNTSNLVSMNISLAGTNYWQSGQDTIEYTVGANGAVTLDGYDPADANQWSLTPLRTRAVDEQLALNYDHLFTQAFQKSKIGAMEAYTLFNEATNVTLPESVVWPDSDFSRSMQRIAKSIAGHATMGHKRQTFFIQYGGWDHHDEVLRSMGGQLPGMSAVVTAFYRTLEVLGFGEKVTLFTASDFGRTLTSNGAGSDHAWGGNQLVVGGALAGRRVFGQYPELFEDNALDVGRGRLIPTTSVDEYFAELALWLGVPKSSLSMVLPNIGTFYDTTSGGNPLGFLP